MIIHSNPILRESKKSRLFRLSLSIFISIFIGLLAGAIYLLAFTGPGTRQPGEGDPDFWVRSSTSTDVYYTGGNVGIGTTDPSQKLDVAGYVKGQSGLCIGSDCRTSWSLSLGQNSCYWTNWGCGQIICPVGYYLVGWDQTSADWCSTNDWEPMRAYCCQP